MANNIKLQVKDRLYLSKILPKETTFMEYAVKRSIMNKIEFKQNEAAELELKQGPQNGALSWNIKKDYENPLVVNLSDDEISLLKNGAEALMGDGKYPDELWVLVEKIYNL